MPTTLTQVGIAKSSSNGARRVETDDRTTSMHLAGHSVAALIMGRGVWGFTPPGLLAGKATIKVTPDIKSGHAKVYDITSKQRYCIALADLTQAISGEDVFIPVMAERTGSASSWYEHELRYESYRVQAHLAMARQSKEVSA